MTILQYILQLTILAVWLLLIPYCVGLLPARLTGVGRRTPGVTFLFGHIITLALFELIAIVVVLCADYDGLSILLAWFTPLVIALAAFGLALEIHALAGLGKGRKPNLPLRPRPLRDFWALPMESRIIWLFFFLILAFQLYMALTRASFDGDDAFFVAQSLIAWQKDVLYRIEPYTGASTVPLLRNMLAAFPVWIAALAEKSRIHPTILSHSILPLFLLPLSYLVYFQIGKSLTRRRPQTLPLFMVIVALFQMFGNVSIYTNETFLMTRTWQGKSFAANFVIPAVLWLFLAISEQMEDDSTERRPNYWPILAILTFCAAIASSLAVFLAVGLVAAYGIFLAIWQKKPKILLKSAAACIPGAAFMVFYIFL